LKKNQQISKLLEALQHSLPLQQKRRTKRDNKENAEVFDDGSKTLPVGERTFGKNL